MFPGFLNGSIEARQRILRLAGAGSVVFVILVGIFSVYVRPAVTPKDPNVLSISIDTPSVGPGVENGTPVVLRGGEVGNVRSLRMNNQGVATIDLDMDKEMVSGLARDFEIDFRPKNYFGITGINIAKPGDEDTAVKDGDRLTRAAGNDYTMSTMIERGSGAATGTLLEPTMQAVKRALDYSAAFEPLLHTGVVVADSVARTQRELPAPLVAKFNSTFNAMPPFTSGAITSLAGLWASPIRQQGDAVQDRMRIAFRVVGEELFGRVGRLLTTNQSNLTPAVQLLTDVSSVLPAMGEGVVTPMTVRTLLERLDGAITDKPGGGKALNINLVLDKLPVLASPLATMPPGVGG